MDKIVYFEGKRIVGIDKMDLPLGYGNRIRKNTRIYIFEDGTYIKAADTKHKNFKYVCEECGCEVMSGTPPERGKNKYYCNKCATKLSGGFRGHHHTQELKDRLSRERKGVWGVGEKNPMYGKNWKDYITPEAIEEHNRKLSELFSGEKNPMYGKSTKDYMSKEKYELWKKHVKDGGYHSKSEEEQKQISQKISDGQKRCQERDPEYYSKIKSRGGKAAAMRKDYKKSSTEMAVENWLINHNVEYDYSPIMGSENTGIYQYDFIIHKKRLLIEVQGDYWHGNPNMFNEDGSDGKRKLNDTQKIKQEKDKLKEEFAKNHNFDLIYIWEEEVNNNDFTKLEKVL